jgi:hypothetical protein
MWLVESGTKNRWFQASYKQSQAIDRFDALEMLHGRGPTWENGRYVAFTDNGQRSCVLWSRHGCTCGSQCGCETELAIKNIDTGTLRLVCRAESYALPVGRHGYPRGGKELINLGTCNTCGFESQLDV